MKKGFTLVELIIVVALILIVGTLSAAFYVRFLSQNDVINATDQIVGNLRKAQLYSMMGKRGGSWGVASLPGEIVLFQGSSYASRDASFDEVSVVNTNVSMSDFTEVVFAKMTGVPDVSPTIVVYESNESRTITINNQGIASQ